MKTLVCSFALCGLVVSAAHAGNLELETHAFGKDGDIPPDYTCDGSDRSPPLEWRGAPENTKAFAITMKDPDAPSGTFTHWVVYNIPDAAKALGENVPKEDDLGDGTRQGKNDFGRIGYGGPCPPAGAKHRYVIHLYALSKPLDLKPGASASEVEKALKAATLAEAEWTGRYRRSEKK